MPFMGIVDTEKWTDADSDLRPLDWTARLFLQNPNGMMFNNGHVPITGFTSLIGNVIPTTDPEFKWWQKEFAAQRASITADTTVFTNAAKSTAYSTTYTTNQASSGTVLYITVPLDFAKQAVPGYTMLMMDEDDNRAIMRTLITDKIENGADSTIVCRTLKNDSGTATYGVDTADKLEIMGSLFEEGSNAPDGMHYDPTKFTNYTAIHKNAVEQTGTALATEQRVDNDYMEDVREQGELHAFGLERDAIFGTSFETTGPNGKPLRGSGGVWEFITDNSPATHNVDYRRDTDFAGLTWRQGGADFLKKFLVEYSIYAEESLVICGNLVLQAIEDLAEYLGWQSLQVQDVLFGIRVNTWVTPYGELHFMPHPAFTLQDAWKRMCIVFNPKNVFKRPLRNETHNRDTAFVEDVDFDQNVNFAARPDAKRAGWLTEAGWQFTNPKQFGILDGFGVDRS